MSPLTPEQEKEVEAEVQEQIARAGLSQRAHDALMSDLFLKIAAFAVVVAMAVKRVAPPGSTAMMVAEATIEAGSVVGVYSSTGRATKG